MKPQINLDLNGLSNSEVVIDADHYVTCMTGNLLFLDPDIATQVAATGTATIKMREAVAAPVSETKTDNIRIARDKLNRSITKLASMVQSLANDPKLSDLECLEIIHEAGMTEKGQTRRQKSQFKVKNGSISGTVLLTAKGRVNAHEWQYTTDVVNFKNRVAADTTTTSITEIKNLEEATKYAFFHKAIQPGTPTDWEGPLLLVIT